MKRDPRYDVVRACSCIFIIVTHLLQYYGSDFAYWLNSFVCTFFCLSGVLISRSKQPTNSLKGIVRRLIKIFPEYYLFVTFSIVIFIMFFKISFKEMIVLLFNLVAFFDVPKGFGHLWFMTGILIAYIITPFLEKEISTLIITLTLVISFSAFKVVPYNLIAGLLCYILGFKFSSYLNESSRKLFYLCVISVFGFTVINLCFMDSKVLSLVRYPFLGMASYYILFHSKIINYILIEKIKIATHFISSHSYSIYLVHGILIFGPLSILKLPYNNFNNISIYLFAVFIFSLVLKICSDNFTAVIQNKYS